MVEEAREKKGRAETLIAPLCGIHPVVILLGRAAAFSPPLLFSQSLRVWLPRALVFWWPPAPALWSSPSR